MNRAAYGVAFALPAICLTACNWHTKSEHQFDDMFSQKQFFYRLERAELYVPEPAMFDKLDLDDKVMLPLYQQDVQKFQQKLDAAHVDINTVLVKPDPAPIRVLAVEEGSPERLWHLFLLTGNDTAQLLPDGIHLRRKGFPEQVLGGPVRTDDLQLHGEMGQNLWYRDARVGWRLGPGEGVLAQVGIRTTNAEIKHVTVPQFRVDCDALYKFAQPLNPGESTRETILKVNIPVTPEQPRCPSPLGREDADRFREYFRTHRR